MTSHTPGPWHTNGGQIKTEANVYDGGIIATVGIVNHQDATDIANARLIAAAPDLLAACQAADELLGRIPVIPNHEGMSGSVRLQLQQAISNATHP